MFKNNLEEYTVMRYRNDCASALRAYAKGEEIRQKNDSIREEMVYPCQKNNKEKALLMRLKIMEDQHLLSPYWAAVSDSLKCQGQWEKIDMKLLLVRAVCCNSDCIAWMERHRKILDEKFVFPEVKKEFWGEIPDKWRKYAPEVYRILCSGDFKFFFSLLEAGWSLFSEALFLRERLTFEDAAGLVLQFCAPMICKIEVLCVLWTMALWYQVEICRELSFYVACECMKERTKIWTE